VPIYFRYDNGQLIFTAGEEAGAIYFIVDGEVILSEERAADYTYNSSHLSTSAAPTPHAPAGDTGGGNTGGGNTGGGHGGRPTQPTAAPGGNTGGGCGGHTGGGGGGNTGGGIGGWLGALGASVVRSLTGSGGGDYKKPGDGGGGGGGPTRVRLVRI